MRMVLIILAAGKGTRFGFKSNKLFFSVEEKPLLCFLLKKIEKFKQIQDVLLVVNKENILSSKGLVKKYNFKKVKAVIEGGERRQDSVFRALQWIKAKKKNTLYTGIHDGARINLSENLVNRLIKELKKYSAVIPGLKVTDTIKAVKGKNVSRTIPRENLYKVSTPQFFKYKALYDSYIRAIKNKLSVTDDASVVEQNNIKVRIIEDDRQNIKLTYKEDLDDMMEQNYKVGIGFDTHRLIPNRHLIIGGVKIKHYLGLEGHSDADVLIHAIIDGMLGAAGAGDIGRLFPDTDKKYKNIDSSLLLVKTLNIIKEMGYIINNLDTIIFAEKPKFSNYSEKIRKNLSKILQIDVKDINIKAKTMEKMGFIGREEGIAAQAIVTLKKFEFK